MLSLGRQPREGFSPRRKPPATSVDWQEGGFLLQFLPQDNSSHSFLTQNSAGREGDILLWWQGSGILAALSQHLALPHVASGHPGAVWARREHSAMAARLGIAVCLILHCSGLTLSIEGQVGTFCHSRNPFQEHFHCRRMLPSHYFPSTS